MLVPLNTLGLLASTQAINVPLSAVTVVKLEIMRFDSGVLPSASVVKKRPDGRSLKSLAVASIVILSPSSIKPWINQLYTMFLPVHLKVTDSPSQIFPLTVLVKVKPVYNYSR